MELELVWGDLGEGSRKHDFALDWMLSRSGSNCVIGCLES